FLQLLFQYRRLFRVIAAKEIRPRCRIPAVVCWVDVVLAKLGDLINLIATEFSKSRPQSSLPKVLVVQQQEDSLRAAIQLPDNWDSLPSLLASDRASPAAKRLTIRLLFGSHVFSPCVSGTTIGHES
ncbi:hypothetical protein ID866_605, partial [Astraeus odoratus]